MTQEYLTARDGYISGEVLIGRAKSRQHVPAYAREATPKPKGLSGQALWDAIDHMSSRIVH